MRAIVLKPFDGVRDGEVMPETFAEGDVLTGDLAEAAVRLGDAKELSEEEADGYAGLTIAQLRAIAAERNIDLTGLKKHADIKAAIELADEAAKTAAGDVEE